MITKNYASITNIQIQIYLAFSQQPAKLKTSCYLPVTCSCVQFGGVYAEDRCSQKAIEWILIHKSPEHGVYVYFFKVWIFNLRWVVTWYLLPLEHWQDTMKNPPRSDHRSFFGCSKSPSGELSNNIKLNENHTPEVIWKTMQMYPHSGGFLMSWRGYFMWCEEDLMFCFFC